MNRHPASASAPGSAAPADAASRLGRRLADALAEAAEAAAAGMSLAERARRVAAVAHAGQVDKSGRAYLEHPARVAARVAAAGYDEEFVAVAWLHDVVEDTALDLADLAAAGFGAEVVAAVGALTKHKCEPLPVAVARAGADRIGRVVKAADVADNTDPARVALLDEATRARLAAKYARTLAVLAEHGAPVFG